MLLSFVVPAYNEEKYLDACLESILRELRKAPVEAEVIVVNNASTDKTREIALKHPGVKVVDEPQKGLVRARRAGFLSAKGELIANIDADTRLTPGWIKTALNEFEKNPKLVALSGPFIYYDLPKKVRYFLKIFYYLAYANYIVNRFMLRLGSVLQGGNFIIRRSALQAIGGYDVNIYFYGEDADLARRMSKVGEVKFTFKLPILASGRRMVAEGAAKMVILYSLNYFWIILFKRPFSMAATDIRITHQGAKFELNPWVKLRDITIGVLALIIIIAAVLGGGFLIYQLISSGILFDW